jgi:F-type H+-transporting ATPase subunit epsilon
MKKFHITISSPQKVIFDGEIESITVPATGGSIQILSDHMPLVSVLEAGDVVYGEESFKIAHGVIEVKDNNRVVVLVVLDEEEVED